MSAPSDSSSLARMIPVAVAVALGGAFLYAARIQLGYSADGAYVFSQVLDSKTFYYPIWSRSHAELFLQGPLVLAARAGVREFPTLSNLYHVGLLLPFLLSFTICWFARRPIVNDALLLFPLISYILVSLPASSILAGQSQVLAVIVWPTLFLILRPRLSRLDYVLLLGLLLVLSRTYEAYLPSALIFLILLVQRLRFAPPAERAPLLVALGLVMVGLAIAGYMIAHPASLQQRHDFLSGVVRDVPRHPLLVSSIAALLALVAALSAPQRRAVAMLPLLLGFGSIGLSALGRIAPAGISFNMRSLSGTLLPLLLLAAVVVQSRSVHLESRGWGLAGVTLVALIAGYVWSWSAWRDFRKDFVTTLNIHTGYVPVEETILAGNRQRWRWTTSLLSIIWSPQCVRTILVSSSPGWQPFDPRKSVPLQNLVRYHESFLASSPNSSHCR